MQDSEKIIKKCPIEEAMKLISKKWVIQLIRDMFFGKSHFNEFKEDKPNLSSKVLSNCLKDMESNGLIQRFADENNPSSTEYTLTSKGLALNRVLYELAKFSLDTDIDNKFYSDERKKELDKLFKITLNID